MVENNILKVRVDYVRRMLFTKVDSTTELMSDRVRMENAIRERFQFVNEHTLVMERERRNLAIERQRIQAQLNECLDHVSKLRLR